MRRAPRLRDQVVSGLSDGEFQVVQTTTLELLQERKLVSNISKNLRVLVETLFVRDCQSRNAPLLLEDVGDTFADELIGDQANHHANGNGKDTKHYRTCPFRTGLRWAGSRYTKGSSTNKDDEDLNTGHDEVDYDEVPILQ